MCIYSLITFLTNKTVTHIFFTLINHIFCSNSKKTVIPIPTHKPAKLYFLLCQKHIIFVFHCFYLLLSSLPFVTSPCPHLSTIYLRTHTSHSQQKWIVAQLVTKIIEWNESPYHHQHSTLQKLIHWTEPYSWKKKLIAIKIKQHPRKPISSRVVCFASELKIV